MRMFNSSFRQILHEDDPNEVQGLGIPKTIQARLGPY